MAARSAEQAKLVGALLSVHGQTFGAELGIAIGRNTPSPLFRWLCASILLSARISSNIAVAAAQALFDSGWTTPEKLAASTWEERTRILNRAGYARYDESTARMLADSAELLLREYRGDLRALRETAGHDPAAERQRLTAFKGIGNVGADIFFREVQLAWDELYPFADGKAAKAAGRLGLPATAESLSGLVNKADYPRLLAALVRTAIARDYDAVRQAA